MTDKTCSRPIGMKNGKYVKCGKPAKYKVGFWYVCEECKKIADYYTEKYNSNGEYDD